MYRKRKHSNDVDVIAIKEQVTLEITEKVTIDIIARLHAQGVNLSLPSNTRPSAGGKSSNCASASDAVCDLKLDKIGGTLDLEGRGHTSCTLVLINREGHQVEVATGCVFPNKTLLYSVPVEEGYVIVDIDFVYREHEGHLLIPRPSNETRTLGDAMYKRIQWRRQWIVVSPQVFSSPILSKPSMPGSAKSNLNVLVLPNVSPSLYEKANDFIVTNCASMAHEQPKLTKSPTTPQPALRAGKSDTKLDQMVVVKQKQLPAPRVTKSDTKLDQKVVVKQKQQVVQHTKLSKSAPCRSCLRTATQPRLPIWTANATSNRS